MAPEDRPTGPAGMTAQQCNDAQEAKSEKELQGHLLNLLRLRGVEPLYSRFGIRTTAVRGTPDILFAYFAVPVGWELKTKTGKISPDQEALHQKLRANGWRICVLRSVAEGKAMLDSIIEERTTK